MNDNKEHTPQGSLSERLSTLIEKGEVTMKPRWHFVTRSAALIVGTILSVLSVIYIASFIIFILHESGAWFVPSFGLRGLSTFLFSLPWLLIVLSIVFIVLIETLIRKFEFGYGKPLVYSAMGLILCIGIGASIVAQTPLHQGLMMKADKDDLPFAGSVYKKFGRPGPNNICAGIVTDIFPDGYIVNEPNERLTRIYTTPQTEIASDDEIELQDKIMVFGLRKDGAIVAVGIKKIERLPLKPQGMMQPF